MDRAEGIERITFVQADDWGGVYIDDELYYEGHSTPPHIWIEVLRKAGVTVFDKSESTDAYNVIQAHGRCPQTLGAWSAIAQEERARAQQ